MSTTEDRIGGGAAATATAAPPANTTNNNKDPTEVSLGICDYLSPSVPGFRAVSKARFSDFLVHEVGVDGRIARLDCLEPRVAVAGEERPAEPAAVASNETLPVGGGKDEADDKKNAAVERKRKRDDDASDGNAKADAGTPAAAAMDWQLVEQELAELLDDAPAARIAVEFLSNNKGAAAAPQKPKSEAATDTKDDPPQRFVSLPPLVDKAKRRALHQWIRSRLDGVALADTDADTKAVRIWRKEYETKMPNYRKFDGGGSRQHNPRMDRNGGRGRNDANIVHAEKYVRFVLYKENMDTGSAVSQLQRSLSYGNQRQQRNQHQQQRWRLGYAGMKDKRGVTAQFITVPAHKVSDLQRYMQQRQPQPQRSQGGAASTGGGGHTQSAGVALMRAGNLEYAPNELSLGKLRGNRFDICLRNVAVISNADTAVATTTTTEQALEAAASALRQHGFINYFGVQRFGKYHDTHLTGFAVLKGDYGAGVDIVMRPKPDEREAAERGRTEWKERFNGCDDTTTTKDDVILEDDNKNERSEAAAKAERDCAKRVLPQFGRFCNSEVAILESLQRYPLDYKRAFSSISKTMRMMFLHAAQSFFWNHVASFRLSKMGNQVIVGDLVYEDEDGADGKRKVKVVTDDDVKGSRYSLEDVVLPLIGTQTRDPENESGKLFDVLLQQEGLTRDMFFQIKDRNLDVTGDYRKLICHPTDVDFEIVEYSDSLQPLMQTDLMKLQGIEVEVSKPSENDADDSKATKLVAMNVGFTLPSSSYATIALRELMKQPTSSEYQRVLSIGKEEEETTYPSQPQEEAPAPK